MKSIRMLFQILLFCSLALAPLAQSDQSDNRLEALFQNLKNSQDDEVLQATESSIWEIWYESGDDEIDAIMQEAGLAVQSGQLRLAESMYDRVIEKLPGFSEGWNRRATVRFYQRDLDGSLADIEQTLRLEPRHFGAIWGLGMILGSKQDYQRAILAFQRLLEIKPNARDARPRIELLKQELAKQAV